MFGRSQQFKFDRLPTRASILRTKRQCFDPGDLSDLRPPSVNDLAAAKGPFGILDQLHVNLANVTAGGCLATTRTTAGGHLPNHSMHHFDQRMPRVRVLPVNFLNRFFNFQCCFFRYATWCAIRENNIGDDFRCVQLRKENAGNRAVANQTERQQHHGDSGADRDGGISQRELYDRCVDPKNDKVQNPVGESIQSSRQKEGFFFPMSEVAWQNKNAFDQRNDQHRNDGQWQHGKELAHDAGDKKHRHESKNRCRNRRRHGRYNF